MNEYFQRRELVGDKLVVVSPDEGSIKRAVGHVKRLGGSLAIVDKRRSSAHETSQENLIGGPVEGRTAILFDDMISTAGSICGAAELVHRAGAEKIYVAATHGVFCGGALQKLHDAPVDNVIVTNSISLDVDPLTSKIEQLDVSQLLGEAIKRIHHNDSISVMFPA